MRAGLIGQNIRNNPALHHLRQNVSAISNQPDRKRFSILASLFDHRKRFIERTRNLVAVTALQTFLDSCWVNFDAEKERAIHGCGERLGAAHSAEPTGYNEFAFQRSAKMFSTRLGKGFESSLHNSLAADVNPRTSGHLPVHRQAKPFEPIELRIIVPL